MIGTGIQARSGWPDSNRRPLRPELSARPWSAQARPVRVCDAARSRQPGDRPRLCAGAVVRRRSSEGWRAPSHREAGRRGAGRLAGVGDGPDRLAALLLQAPAPVLRAGLHEQQAAPVHLVDRTPPPIRERLAAVPYFDEGRPALAGQRDVEDLAELGRVRGELGGDEQCVVGRLGDLPVGYAILASRRACSAAIGCGGNGNRYVRLTGTLVSSSPVIASNSPASSHPELAAQSHTFGYASLRTVIHRGLTLPPRPRNPAPRFLPL